MGAFTGSITYKQYFVDGDLPDGFRDQFETALRENAFRELDHGEERSLGWVTSEDLLDADFALPKFLFGHFMVMALREDCIKIPPTTLKVHIQQEETLTRQRLKRERLSKFERDEIREAVQKRLLGKMLPTIRAYDVVWNLETRAVWLWTHNRALAETFEDLFERTFGLRLVPYNTYCALQFAGLPERDMERALELEPADLITGS